jgi:hypothetical protein
MELGAVFFACDLARFPVIRAFFAISNPLCLLGLWLGLKLFSLFVNIFLSNGIWGSKFLSVARRNATPRHTTLR